MRQWVQHLITFPPTPDIAYSVGAYTVICGDWANVGTMAHEFVHVMDYVALTDFVPTPYVDYFSGQPAWQNPEMKDRAIPTEYAGHTWAENFAEAGRVSLSDMVVPGGLRSINANASQVANQVSNFEKYAKGIMFPAGGVCTIRVAPTDPVPVSGSRSGSVAGKSNITSTAASGAILQLPKNVTPKVFMNPQKPTGKLATD